MWRIPKTLEGAKALDQELRTIDIKRPPGFVSNYPGLHVNSDREDFDFSDLHYGNIFCWGVDFWKDGYYINLKEGHSDLVEDTQDRAYSGQIRINPAGVWIFVQRPKKIERTVWKIFQDLEDNVTKNLWALWLKQEEWFEQEAREEDYVLNAIEGLWQEGYQFDEYLPGSHEGTDVSDIVKIINSGFRREGPILQIFRAYYLLHIIKPEIYRLFSDDNSPRDTYDEAIRDFAEQVQRLSDLRDFADQNFATGIKSNLQKSFIETLYSIVTRDLGEV